MYIISKSVVARIFHELPSRDRATVNPLAGLSGAARKNRCALGQPQGPEPKAYL
jgi:hypothetical protein